ncbi:RNA polymerase sigma factor [Alicyclobacillus vulcanalis]|uniref:RNA polymerase sigma-70 factor, ECF subfamily n=1 Tax=Alicyclobacillus vulcanalis TaxID=252246 RepID=A0A1N7LEM3_9BACL|nr:sigma-70 family RNA polymerase sigma factor [Alicyclobacillus vulcanalis]SIS72240.1 RNA polymerase sigma-70 factor, ECF subfamily [Alicyclobacillus vulcanalis]
MVPLTVLHDMVDRARLGDDVCLHALFEMFRPLLRRTAWRYARVAGYDEAYQEACAAFLCAIATHDATAAPFPAYAAKRVYGDTRTAMRKLWLHQDRTAFQREREDEENEDWDERRGDIEAGDSMAPYRCIEDRLVLLHLARSANLSPREAAWFALEFEGLETDEIAERLGVCPATVRTWRMRALRKMREQATRTGWSKRDI